LRIVTNSFAGAVLLIAAAIASDPLSLLAPCISLTARDRSALSNGEVIGRTLAAHDGQVAVFASTQLRTNADTLVTATRAIADLKKSRFVVAIRRFSDPPVLTDLDELVLSDRDVAALASCELNRCSFKLTATEIAAIVHARAGGASRDALQAALKRVLLDRVHIYLAEGLGAVSPIVNRSKPHVLSETLRALQAASPCVAQTPALAAWLAGVPRNGGDVESFMYWSQEYYGSGKPVVLLTHVAIQRDSPDAAVVMAKQIFASRYMNGGFAITAVTTNPHTGAHYLTYFNRSAPDLLGGFLGPIKRNVLESRLSDELPEIILRLRARLEGTSP
jgi:hypothetical protein